MPNFKDIFVFVPDFFTHVPHTKFDWYPSSGSHVETSRHLDQRTDI